MKNKQHDFLYIHRTKKDIENYIVGIQFEINKNNKLIQESSRCNEILNRELNLLQQELKNYDN